MTDKMRVMSVMAHQDDLEFEAGGTFALLRKTYGSHVALHVLATSRGASGHHDMPPDQVYAQRDHEARQSAALIGATYECLTQLDGSHVPGQVMLDRNLLGGLWNAIRSFEPHVIFCPPVTADPLAGIHVDHFNTAQAVRMVAYQILVPNAYPTLNGPRKLQVRVPLIINVEDSYSGPQAYPIRQDITEVFETKRAMAMCHKSQVFEWLPFTEGATKPMNARKWKSRFRESHYELNKRHAFSDRILSEYFQITQWGRVPDKGEIERIFPKILARKAV
jgi:LmbE family N-acetylglucosaminyl deacetylase